MNLKYISNYNLIEILTGKRKEVLNTISPKTHCEQNHISDFYCDAERPHISSNAISLNQ